MASYKLTYFNAKALAEPIRFLLNILDIEFVDDRFERENWPQIKPTTPFGQVPVLEIDGKKVSQSTAICRYLAKKAGLTGKDDWEDLEIDAIVDTIHDFRTKIASPFYETHEEAKAQKVELAKEMEPYYIQKFDKEVEKNGGYFVGGKLTWADILFVGILDYLNFVSGHNVIEKAENLKALKQKVHEVPAIKAWIAKRPETDA